MQQKHSWLSVLQFVLQEKPDGQDFGSEFSYFSGFHTPTENLVFKAALDNSVF